MSVHVSSWAWKQKVGDPGTKLVLVKLADNADDTGYSYWKQKNLAAECEMARSTCQKKIDKLVSMGIVEVVPRWGSDGQQISNGYRIIRPDDPARIPGTAATSGRAGGATPEKAGGATPDEAAGTVIEPSLEPSVDVVVRTWLDAPGMIQHRPSYFAEQKIRRLIDKIVRKYGVDDVAAAIASYATVLASSDHFFNHRWTFGDFLSRGIDRFVPEAEPEKVFRAVRGGKDNGSDGKDAFAAYE